MNRCINNAGRLKFHKEAAVSLLHAQVQFSDVIKQKQWNKYNVLFTTNLLFPIPAS